jgi:hypothetical protein
MRFIKPFLRFVALVTIANTITLQNVQVRDTYYPDTRIDSIGGGWNSTAWSTYDANASEPSYKGRWDRQHVSWWAAPGLRFGFEGEDVAITFGQYTSNGGLVAHRVGGWDWQFTNITTNVTHHLVTASTPGLDLTQPD